MHSQKNASLFALFIIACLFTATVMIVCNRDEIAAAQAQMKNHFAAHVEVGR